MSLPPERVNIKRKRDAEAVDVLFLQDKKRARTKFIFQKIEPASGDDTPGPSSRKQGVEPQIATTAAGAAASSASRLIAPFSTPKQSSKRLDATKRSGLREFRLDRLSNGRVEKPGHLHGPSSSSNRTLATFLETRESLRAKLEKAQVERIEGSTPKKTHLTAPKRLRPRASAADLEWRQKTWGSATGSSSVSQARPPEADDSEELKLAESLNAFALEATKAISAPSPLTPSKTLLKFQPKPAPPRDPKRVGDNASEDIDMTDDEADYEYDTYVRIPVGDDGMAMEIDADEHFSNPAFIGKSLGVLVIEDEDEELWATYALDDEQDEGFETDEEDENAEDYYGNDYPEDELNSDDEFDRGAYGYRYADSDDEHYGHSHDNDEAELSDDDGRLSRLIGSQSAHALAHEFASPVQHHGLDPY